MLEATTTARLVVAESFRDALRPDPIIDVNQWAEANRILQSKESAAPGPYRLHVTPYLREIGEVLSVTSPVRDVALMKAAQIGATAMLDNVVGYAISCAPSPILFVFTSDKIARRHSRQKLDPMIQSAAVLRERVSRNKPRSSANTVTLKDFPGGILALIGANSPSELRSYTARFLLLDEIDGYPWSLDEEGDPVELAQRATRSFGDAAKRVYCSTPTVRGRSRIEAKFQAGDRRRYFVPCPHCGEHQVLWFTDPETGRKGLRWEGEGLALVVWYECKFCGARILEDRKAWMLEQGEWRPEVPELSEVRRSYHLSALYAPRQGFSWTRVVESFLESHKIPERFRVFVNQTLGESFEDRGDAPEWSELHKRCEPYKIGVVPARAFVLVAGVDVQQSRIEVEFVAYGPRLESWSVGYHVFNGDTSGPEPWNLLTTELARLFPHEAGGVIPVRLACVDSSFAAQEVYRYVRSRPLGTVLAVKGWDQQQPPVGVPTYQDVTYAGRKLRRGVQLWPLGVSTLKRELYGFLRGKPTPGATDLPWGYCHFPEYDENYFKGLTAERLQGRQNARGFIVYEWRKVYERNEPLDCRNYARGAAAILGIDRWNEADWARAAAAVTAPPKARPVEDERASEFQRWRRRSSS